MNKGLIIYATDNAKKHYREKRKTNKVSCQNCEIKTKILKNTVIDKNILNIVL